MIAVARRVLRGPGSYPLARIFEREPPRAVDAVLAWTRVDVVIVDGGVDVNARAGVGRRLCGLLSGVLAVIGVAKNVRRAAVLVFWSGLAAACASKTPRLETMDPSASVWGTYYELDVHERNWGDVRVGPAAPPPGEKGGLVFDLRIRNDSSEVLSVDLARFEVELIRDRSKRDIVNAPSRSRGRAECPPGSTSRLRVTFTLPPKVSLDAVRGVELSWVVQTPAGPYSQSTLFRRGEPPGARSEVIYTIWQPWYVPRWPGAHPRRWR